MKPKGNVIRKLRCPKCGYVWEPRVKQPKSCPECKQRLGWYTHPRGKKWPSAAK